MTLANIVKKNELTQFKQWPTFRHGSAQDPGLQAGLARAGSGEQSKGKQNPLTNTREEPEGGHRATR
jgi:hypothetical protein